MSRRNCAAVQPLIVEDVVSRIKAQVLPVAKGTRPIVRARWTPSALGHILCRSDVLQPVSAANPR